MIDLFRVFMAPEARDAAVKVLTPNEHGRIYVGQGPIVEQFERALADLFQSDVPLLSTNSCTSALDLALHLCGVIPQCEDDSGAPYVITTPMTCSATNGSIVTRGAHILWADVDPLTGLIDPASVAELLRIHSNVVAIIAVDWAGRACDYGALRDVAQGIPIIEDAAHAPLANYNGRSIAYMGGDYIAWSFGAIKHISGGDGCGALSVRVPLQQYDRARLLRWHGLDRTKGDSFRCSQNITEVGFRYNLSDLNAAIALANLPHLPDVVYRHRQHARFYHEALAGLPGITLPPPDAGSSWWLYTLLLPDEAARDEFIQFLAQREIAASPVHARNDRHTGFGGPLPAGTLPGVDAFASRECAIPVGWWVTQNDLDRVVATVKEWTQCHP